MKHLGIWFAMITLAGLAAARLALADDSLFPTPPRFGQAAPQAPGSGPGPGPGGGGNGRCAPDGGDCLRNLRQWRESETKRVLAGLAEEISRKQAGKCIHAREAFSFQPPNPGRNTWTVRCLAQSGGVVSHLIEFQLNVTTQPQDCLSDANLHQFFIRPLSPTEGEAEMLRQSCQIGAMATPALQVTSSAIDVKYLNDLLRNRTELGKIIDSSDFSVKVPDDGGSNGPRPAATPASPRPVINNPLAPPLKAGESDAD